MSTNLKTLDDLRYRLAQLSTSMEGLQRDLVNSPTLPSWSSLQESAQNLALNLQQLSEIFAANQIFLTRAHAYPLDSFPGHSRGHILETLLRKKLEPRAENWIDGLTTAKPENMNELRELWNWAGPAGNDLIRQILGGGGENEDDDDDEDEDMDEDTQMEDASTSDRKAADSSDSYTKFMEGKSMSSEEATSNIDTSVPSLALNNMLRLLSTGDLHSHVRPYRQ